MAAFRDWVKLNLFFSSYIPLLLAMSIKVGHFNVPVKGFSVPILSLIFLSLSILSAIILILVFKVSKSKEPKFKSINSYKGREDLLTSYLIPYIFPFIGLNYGELSSWAILGIFFVILAAIQIPSNHLYINPILSLFGYRIYEIDGDQAEKSILIADREEDISDGQLKVVELESSVYLSV